MEEINTTLKKYLEEIISRVSERKVAKELIESEDKRLAESKRMLELAQHPWAKHLVDTNKATDLESLKKLFSEAQNVEDVATGITKILPQQYKYETLISAWRDNKIDGQSFGEVKINEARKIFGLPPIEFKTKSK